MVKTALFSRKQPGGVFVFTDESQTTGDIWFVNSASGTDGVSAGRNPDAPLDSIAYTLSTIVTASQGDRVYVMPGHTEAVSAASGIVAKAGTAVIGLGEGANRPTITWGTSTAATIAVSAANTRFENMVFDLTGIDAVVAPFIVSAADCTFRKCRFIVATASGQATAAIVTTAAGSRLTVEDCQFIGTGDAGTTCAITIVGGDGHRIVGNTFFGAYSSGVGAIRCISTACTNTLIRDNHINNVTASSTKAITMLTASTGQITRNYMQILSGTAPITGDAMSWVGANYYAATIATAGTLI
jgi:hypothetical protein